MKSRLMFRDSGHPIQTRRDPLTGWIWIACAIAVLLLTLGYAGARDEADALRMELATVAHACPLGSADEGARP